MPAWNNKRAQDKSVYDWELIYSQEGTLCKLYRCQKTGKWAISEALPKNQGDKFLVLIADEWKEEKTEAVFEYIDNCETVKDIIT